MQLIVPRLADWATVDLVADNGLFCRVEVARRDPSDITLLSRLAEIQPLSQDDDFGLGRVVRTLLSEWEENVPEVHRAQTPKSPELPHLLSQLGLRSYIVTPLSLRGRVFGAITLARGESGRRFEASDLWLADELARRASVAIDNARLYQDDRRSEELQTRHAQQAALSGDVGAALTHHASMRDMLQRCAQAMVDRLGASFARVWTVDAEERVLELRASAGLYTHIEARFRSLVEATTDVV